MKLGSNTTDETLDFKFRSMTDVEHGIFDSVALGHSTAEIAAQLRVSERVIEQQISDLFLKFDARNTAHLVYIVMMTIYRAGENRRHSFHESHAAFS